MQIASNPLIVNPAAPASANATGPDAASSETGSFAKLLSAQHPASAPAEDKPVAPEARDTAKADAAAQDDAENPQDARSAAARRGVGRGAGRAGAPREPAHGAKVDTKLATQTDPKADTMRSTDTEHKDADAAATGQDLPAADPALADWLAALHRPATAAGDAVDAGGGAKEVRARSDAAPGDTQPPSAAEMLAARGAGARADDQSTDRAAERFSDRLMATSDAQEARQGAGIDAALRAASDTERGETRFERSKLPDLAAAHGAAGIQPAGHDAGSSASTVVNLSTPVGAPEFREALGMQVSVLARDGVQHAELHLNPAEMGPITVQIALDGTQAQVDFGADSFATRQLIEAGLPELASALRDAGFTLTGGGVSQHSHGQGRSGQQAGHGVGVGKHLAYDVGHLGPSSS